jgi:hypothetical protein
VGALPNFVAMSQVSRPVQIALLVVIVAAAAWFVALRPKSSSSTGGTPAPVATTPAPTSAAASGANTPVVGGLLKDVGKARGAVATSQANANQLQHDSAAASSSNPATATGGAPAVSATAPAGTQTPTGSANTAKAGSAGKPAAAPAAPTNPAVKIGQQLANGKTVALLFWNPLSSDDTAVHDALKSIFKHQKKGGTLVVDFATPGQVPSYGKIVTASQVLETPTLLLMRGKNVQSITDLQDPADLRQYVGDIDQGGPGEKTLPALTAYTPGTSRTAYVARMNAACRKAKKDAKTPPSIPAKATLAQAIKIVVSYLDAALNRVDGIPKPKADAAYLAKLFGAERRANQEAIDAAATRDPYKQHDLLLSAETNNDYAANGFTSYGMLDCVAPELVSQR